MKTQQMKRDKKEKIKRQRRGEILRRREEGVDEEDGAEQQLVDVDLCVIMIIVL